MAYANRSFARCRLGQAEASLDDMMQALRLDTSLTEAVQGHLRYRGFYKGAIDGVFDSASQQALRDWTVAGCPSD